MTIKIRKFAYLKTPLFSWSAENSVGGAFSNSGMHRSAKACLSHARHMLRNLPPETPVQWFEVTDDAETLSKVSKLGTN